MITTEAILKAAKACKEAGFEDLSELAACLAFASIQSKKHYHEKVEVGRMILDAVGDALRK